MTAPRAPHVLPASQHEPGAGSGSVSRQSSPQPCQGDNLGHICPGKGLKGSSQVWFPSGKTPSLIDCSYPQLGVHWRGSAPQGTLQKWDIYPEQTFGLKGVVPVLAGSFLVHHLSSHFLTSQNKLFPCLLIHRFLWPWVFRYHTHRAATVGVVLAGFREQNESVFPSLGLDHSLKTMPGPIWIPWHAHTLSCIVLGSQDCLRRLKPYFLGTPERKVNSTISITHSMQKSLCCFKLSTVIRGQVTLGWWGHSGTPPELSKHHSEPPRHGDLVTLHLEHRMPSSRGLL